MFGDEAEIQPTELRHCQPPCSVAAIQHTHGPGSIGAVPEAGYRLIHSLHVDKNIKNSVSPYTSMFLI